MTSTMISLEGKVALVTGGSGGIGSAVVRRLGQSGADVISVDLPGTAAAAGAAQRIADVSNPAAVQALLDGVQESHQRLDVLVHCAGMTRDAVLWKMADEDWDAVLRVNLDSAFHLLKRATPLMRSGKGGSIVLVSSVNAERGKFGQASYTASKAGLLGLGRTAARELGKFAIRVNIVSPGWIDTAMTAKLPEEMRQRAVDESALGATGSPEDVAAAVLFLVSDLSRHITGQVLRVDGGQLMA